MAEFTGDSDLDIVSVEPCEPVPGEWDWDTGHLYTYRVTPSSMITSVETQTALAFFSMMLGQSALSFCSVMVVVSVPSGAILDFLDLRFLSLAFTLVTWSAISLRV